jgi:hypothetical protein
MTSEHNTPIEHQNVPSAHQGLHSFLYSSDDEHTSTIPSVVLDNDGSQIMAVEEWQTLSNQVKVAGVYGVLDASQTYQYIGYSRDVRKSLEAHIAQHGVEICALIRVQSFKFPKREVMENLRDEWIGILDYVPIGNQEGTWASSVGEAAKIIMSESDRHAYEEKKLKLRKAMADTTLIDEVEKTQTEIERRQQLEEAVKNDDWSSVVRSVN